MGAGVITVTPVAPPPVQVRAANPVVQLATIPSPFELYPRVVGTALQNGAGLLQTFLADPLPITRVTVSNQLGAFADAVAALEDGDAGAFLTATADVFLEPLRSLEAAASYFGTLISQPFALEFLVAIVRSPVLNGIAAAGAAVWEVVEAAVALDLVDVVNAVLNIPARILDGVLNGGYELGGYFGELGGLLSPWNEDGERPGGLIAVAMQFASYIADTIPPRPSAAAVGAPPDPTAEMVTLEADAGLESTTAMVSSSSGQEAEDVSVETGGDEEDVPGVVEATDGDEPAGEEGSAGNEGEPADEDLDGTAPDAAPDPGDEEPQSAEDERSDDTADGTETDEGPSDRTDPAPEKRRSTSDD